MGQRRGHPRHIRKGASEYSSITFYLTGTTHPLLISRKALRFWVKLDEVNKMEFNLVQEG